MPNLEQALKEFPQLKFIGHGPGFWGSISGEVRVVGQREDGPIRPGGALDRLMDKYPNLYGTYQRDREPAPCPAILSSAGSS
jgi:hypothetical protein